MLALTGVAMLLPFLPEIAMSLGWPINVFSLKPIFVMCACVVLFPIMWSLHGQRRRIAWGPALMIALILGWCCIGLARSRAADPYQQAAQRHSKRSPIGSWVRNVCDHLEETEGLTFMHDTLRFDDVSSIDFTLHLGGLQPMSLTEARALGIRALEYLSERERHDGVLHACLGKPETDPIALCVDVHFGFDTGGTQNAVKGSVLSVNATREKLSFYVRDQGFLEEPYESALVQVFAQTENQPTNELLTK